MRNLRGECLQNLCGKPLEHFRKHVESGRRLIDNKPQRCGRCDGFGHKVIGKSGDRTLVRSCHECGGTGKAVNV